ERKSGRSALAWPSGIASVAAPGSIRALLDSSSIAAFPCCFVSALEPGFLPSTSVSRLQRYYEPLRHPPAARRPNRLSAEPTSGHRRRDSRVARCSLLACRHPSPRRSGLNLSSGYVQSMAAFPQSKRGQPSHRVFRGRLGVHACYSLPTCRRPNAAFCLPGSGHFVTSVAAEIATRLGRPLPGQDLHLLEQRTFHGAPGLAHQT